jgi:4'-phosphopantetheinyl transferase
MEPSQGASDGRTAVHFRTPFAAALSAESTVRCRVHETTWRNLDERTLTIEEGDVHVWRADIDEIAARPDAWELLTPGERARSGRFVSEADRRRFGGARVIARLVLSRYLDTPAACLQFAPNQYGKPVLLDSGGLRFNLSHSHRLVLCAVAHGHEVGVDVEFTERATAWQEVAQHYLADEERRLLESMPPAAARAAFFDVWVRKEALLKGAGVGLRESPLSIHVPVRPLLRPTCLRGAAVTRRTPWMLAAVHPAEAYRAAVAIEGRRCRVICVNWTS